MRHDRVRSRVRNLLAWLPVLPRATAGLRPAPATARSGPLAVAPQPGPVCQLVAAWAPQLSSLVVAPEPPAQQPPLWVVPPAGLSLICRLVAFPSLLRPAFPLGAVRFRLHLARRLRDRTAASSPHPQKTAVHRPGAK